MKYLFFLSDMSALYVVQVNQSYKNKKQVMITYCKLVQCLI